MPSAAKPLGVGLTVSSEAPLPEGRARTGSAAAGPPDRGLPAQDRPAQAHPPGPRRRCSRVSRRRAPALGRSVRRSPAAGGGRGAGAAAPATCSRAPRTQRSSTYHPVERRPHRCAGHRQAPCTVSMPPGRRAPALRLRRPHRGLQSHESAWSRRTCTWGDRPLWSLRQGEDRGARPGRDRAVRDGCGRRRICCCRLSQLRSSGFDRPAQPWRAVVEVDEVGFEVRREFQEAAQRSRVQRRREAGARTTVTLRTAGGGRWPAAKRPGRVW